MKNKILLHLLLLMATIGITGCPGGGGEFHLKVEPAKYQDTKKLDMDVLLVLNEDFKNVKWSDETGQAGWEAHVVYLGENFIINSEKLANVIFSNVTIVDSVEQALIKQGDAILKPTVISVMKNRPMWKSDDSTMTVALEWSLTDKNLVPIWITTIIGEGSAGITDDEERVKLLIDDLFAKSYNGIVSSPEIKYFITSNLGG